MQKYLVQLEVHHALYDYQSGENRRNLVECIKHVRHGFGLGLKDAKDFVDGLDRNELSHTCMVCVVLNEGQIGRLLSYQFITGLSPSVIVLDVKPYNAPVIGDFSHLQPA